MDYCYGCNHEHIPGHVLWSRVPTSAIVCTMGWVNDTTSHHYNMVGCAWSRGIHIESITYSINTKNHHRDLVTVKRFPGDYTITSRVIARVNMSTTPL